MEKLISMVDYVLEQKQTETLDTSQIMWYDKEVDKLIKIRNYANFLKQPLNLGMFVACDENGNVLQEPSHFDLYKLGVCPNDTQIHECGKYQKSKEKVLFEGFEIRNKDNFYFIEKKESSLWFRVLKNTNKTIEHLIPLWVEIKLTDNGIKQINL